METWSAHHLLQESIPILGNRSSQELTNYAISLQRRQLPVIFTLRHLSKITNVNYLLLRKTVMRYREMANYRIFTIKKRSGGRRHIHRVSKELFKVQQFINTEILQKITPHHASFAFHSKGGIHACALSHCGARWLFQYDLKDFFYSIDEIDIYNIFKDNGYRPLLAFELARICTTTALPKDFFKLLNYKSRNLCYMSNYKFYTDHSGLIGVLPQGAPSSPMLSNLAAFKLDNSLTELADKYGLIYTRYADDITFSSLSSLPRGKIITDIHKAIIKAIRKNDFYENAKKTRIAGPGARKLVLGLLVDGAVPRIPKETYKRIERLLYAINKYTLLEVAKHEKFDTPYGLYNHLSGLLAFVKDVDIVRWRKFQQLFLKIAPP
ncbi:reverse transcriptase family protein [Snodgrassella sp. ESL0253]|uniref:reverse transcriptase family protein n=1 Tax=Snodgrassella sp. ESL0253 TaxID=2705031 RepID=UPI00158228AA|nr:reverse transcriptase family protein [Snodgrassella sp. ESL0253]NUE65819.1 RNA-directed DNA polymerase [Snodgrassella sp. ESL0253]